MMYSIRKKFRCAQFSHLPTSESFILGILYDLQMLIGGGGRVWSAQLSAPRAKLFNSCYSVHSEELFESNLILKRHLKLR